MLFIVFNILYVLNKKESINYKYCNIKYFKIKSTLRAINKVYATTTIKL